MENSEVLRELLTDPALTNPRRKTGDPWYLAIGGFVAAMVLGWHTVFYNSIIPGDGYSRVLSAYYVFLRPHPHFAAIGFVWNPLPSLLEIPLTLLHHWWPAVVTKGFAGNIVSAAFYGVGLANLYRALHWLRVPRATRLVWALLYGLNPLILWYGANGMSDGMLVAALLGMAEGLLAFFETDNIEDLVRSALWIAVGFLLRYEAVPVAAFAGLGLIIALIRQGRSRGYIEGMLLVFELPIVYIAGIWMFTNWLIMHNPLYFLLSPYGNLAQTGTGSYTTPATRYAYQNLFHSILMVAHWQILFFPVAIAIVAVLVGEVRNSHRGGLAIAGAAIGAPVLQVALLYMGKSADWARFFIYYVPFGYVLMAMAAQNVRRHRRVAVLAATVILLLGNVGTWKALQSPRWGTGDHRYIAQILKGHRVHPFQEDIHMASYINTHAHLKVLLDTFTTFAVVPYVKRPNQFLMTADLNFEAALLNPLGQVNAFLVPEPVGVGALNAINRQYPGLWAGNVSWTRLIKTFPGPSHYRLYAILPDAP